MTFGARLGDVAGLLDPRSEDDVAAVRSALAELAAAKRGNFGHALTLLAISLFLFVSERHALGGHTAEWIGALVLVLVVHEGGHLMAMRAFGYRDLKVFFIPFLGAAASGRKSDATAVQRAIVSLMGPLPGIVLALGATLFLTTGGRFTIDLITLAIVINAFNLLPFVPFDGGRYLDASLFSRWPVARHVVGLASGALVAAIGWYLDAWLLTAFGVLTFLGAGMSRAFASGAADLRAHLDPESETPATIPDVLVPHAIESANLHVFANVQGRRLAPLQYANAITRFWQQVGQRPPSTAATLVLLVAYGGSVALAIAAFDQLGVI